MIYYAGLRPEEAVNLRRENVTIPPLAWNEDTQTWEEPADDWGELQFCSAAPEVGAEWTDHAPNAIANFCFEVTLGYRRGERVRR